MSEKEHSRPLLNGEVATMVVLVSLVVEVVCGFAAMNFGSRHLMLGFALSTVAGGVVMTLLALKLFPSEITRTEPTGAAWVIGSWQDLLSGLSIGCIFGVCWSLVQTWAPPSRGIPADPEFQIAVMARAQPLISVAALVLLGPITEELMFRGILYGGYRRSLGPVSAAVLTTAIFVALHLPSPFELPWCRLHWRAVGPAIAAHSGINLALVLPALISTWSHGSTGRTMADYLRAVRTHPTDPFAFYQLGVAECKASNFSNAIVNLTRAMKLGEDSSSIYVYRGNAKFKVGDDDGAILDYDKAIELNPNDSLSFYDRGLARSRNADYEGAIADYNRSIALDPGNSWAYENRGLARFGEGQIESAMADLNQAIELSPTNSTYYNDRGWAEYLKGDFGLAIADANHSIQLNPNLGYAYGTRGWARYGEGDVTGAIADCKRATGLDKLVAAPFFFDQGLLDFIAKDYKKAIADWQKAIEHDPDLKKELQPWLEKARKNASAKIPASAEDLKRASP